MLDLYILETCPYCKQVMNYMKENGIKFHKFDTINNDNALKLLSIGGKDQVPFLYNEDTDDKILMANTRNIDIVLGGHSHSFFKELKYVNNLDGISIPNDQNGKSGIYVGRITVDMKKKK